MKAFGEVKMKVCLLNLPQKNQLIKMCFYLLTRKAPMRLRTGQSTINNQASLYAVDLN